MGVEKLVGQSFGVREEMGKRGCALALAASLVAWLIYAG